MLNYKTNLFSTIKILKNNSVYLYKSKTKYSSGYENNNLYVQIIKNMKCLKGKIEKMFKYYLFIIRESKTTAFITILSIFKEPLANAVSCY